MRFTYAGWAHEEEALVRSAGEITCEGFGVALGEFERLRVLRGPGLAVGEISNVAFEIAVFIALGNPCTLEDATGAIFHAAVAGDGEFTSAVGAGDEFPSGAAAELAIFEGHRVRVEGQNTRARRRGQAGVWTICESGKFPPSKTECVAPIGGTIASAFSFRADSLAPHLWVAWRERSRFAEADHCGERRRARVPAGRQ